MGSSRITGGGDTQGADHTPFTHEEERLERDPGICSRLQEQEEAQAFPSLPHLGPNP